MASSEIHSVQSISGNQPRIRRLLEAAGNVFLAGTPVALNAAGFVIPIASPLATFTNVQGAIIGTCKVGGNNLATAGVAQQQTFGSVPNEPLAQNISRPYFNDGKIEVEIADPDTIFLGQVGPAQTATQSLIGTPIGITKDSDNHWFFDTTKTTLGTNTVAMVVKLDPNDQSATPRGIYVRFIVGEVQSVA